MERVIKAGLSALSQLRLKVVAQCKFVASLRGSIDSSRSITAVGLLLLLVGCVRYPLAKSMHSNYELQWLQS